MTKGWTMTTHAPHGRDATFRCWPPCDGCGHPATPAESVLAVDYDAIQAYEQAWARWEAKHGPKAGEDPSRSYDLAELAELPDLVSWWWGHARCVAFKRQYEIDAERIQTNNQWMSWSLHLRESKGAWFPYTDWDCTVRRFYEWVKPESTIADYIAAGESETVEFKGSLRWDFRQKQVNKALEKTVARTVAAFMNSKGGTLVVGVSDEGPILRLEADLGTLGSRQNRDGWEQALRNALNTYLSKEISVLVQATFAADASKTVAVLRADPARRPVYLTDGQVAEFYVRSGNTTQQLDVRQANEYVRQRFPALA